MRIIITFIGSLLLQVVNAQPHQKTASGFQNFDTFSSIVAVQELERLDPRSPLPLTPKMAHHQKQNMRAHLEAVQSVISSLAKSDFKGVEVAAQKMGYSEQMQQMCTHMGAGAAGFSEMAIAFHKTADTIAVAAQTKDPQKVLAALGSTLQTCTGCHAKYRQQIVEDSQSKHPALK